MSIFSMKGRVACITGASSGIGRAAASMLGHAGAKVVGVARRTDALEEWSSSLAADAAADAGAVAGSAFVTADLARREDIPNIAQRIAMPFGPPDILVNAAGINTRQHADDVTAEGWDMTLTLNLAAPFFLAQALVPDMKAKGWGRILNIGSLQSRRAFSNGLSYGASKGGIEQLTRAMAEAWSAHGVMVNAIAPGFFPTELTRPVFDDSTLAQSNAARTCIGRNGMMQDLEGPLLFFCSDAASYVSGQMLFVDGGFTAK